jgi:ABC-type phosphonate transport system ATPase subunit
MIEAHGLVKRYGSTMAVNDLSFSIRPGLVCSSPSCTPSPGRCSTAGTPEGGQVAMVRASR